MIVDWSLYVGDSASSRYSCEKPFVKGGWKYATDGRICVRAKTEEADSVAERLPPVWSLFGDWPRLQDFTIPSLPPPLCPKCGDLWEHRCPQCGSTHECRFCEDEDTDAEVGGWIFRRFQLARVRPLSPLALVIRISAKDPSVAQLCFEALDGVQGVVCSVKKKGT